MGSEKMCFLTLERFHNGGKHKSIPSLHPLHNTVFNVWKLYTHRKNMVRFFAERRAYYSSRLMSFLEPLFHFPNLLFLIISNLIAIHEALV